MKVVLIAGGRLDESFCTELLENECYDKLIAIDRGLEFLHGKSMKPDLIVGDFDSLPEGILDCYKDNTPIRQFVPEKDATDMEIGIRSAMEMGAGEIVILGGTGTRIDHVLGNVQTLMIPLQEGIEAYMADANNRIRLLSKDTKFKREEIFGSYVSLLPLTTTVEGVTLKGFKYPLYNHTFTSDNSLGVSNEIIEAEAVVQLTKGVLIMIESKD